MALNLNILIINNGYRYNMLFDFGHTVWLLMMLAPHQEKFVKIDGAS